MRNPSFSRSRAAGFTLVEVMVVVVIIGILAGMVVTTYGGRVQEEAPVIDGLTGDQRFFLATAQALRSKHREESLREHLLKAPHSPEEFRINGILRNVDAWYEAFNVNQDHELYLPPEERVRLW